MTLVDKLHDPLEPLLQQKIEIAPERTWEGKMLGVSGSSRRANIGLKASLGFHGGLVEGRGRTPDFPSRTPNGSGFEVTGTVFNGAVQFDVWFDAPIARRTPFVCTGTINDDMTVIEARFSVDCFSPNTCGCGGGTGTLQLKRVG